MPPMIAVGDAVWNSLIGGVVAIILAFMAHKLGAIKKTGEETQKTGEKTHTLVNSNFGAQLKLGAELSRWKANQTGKAEHLEAADIAEKLLQEHEKKQSVVDSKEK